MGQDMNRKKWFYYLSKFTLIDEVMVFLYWATVVCGLFFIPGFFKSGLLTGLFFAVYIVMAVVVYMYVLKRVASFLKGGSE